MATAAAATRLSGPVLSIPNYAGSASPNRVKLAAQGGTRLPAKSVSVSSPPAPSAASQSRRSCMCSPTNHPGSFRCSLHKEHKAAPGGHGHTKPASPPSPPPSAVVSTGSVGGRAVQSQSGMWARRALTKFRQSQLRRRFAAGVPFRPRPSRLSAVSFAGERAGDNGL